MTDFVELKRQKVSNLTEFTVSLETSCSSANRLYGDFPNDFLCKSNAASKSVKFDEKKDQDLEDTESALSLQNMFLNKRSSKMQCAVTASEKTDEQESVSTLEQEMLEINSTDEEPLDTIKITSLTSKNTPQNRKEEADDVEQVFAKSTETIINDDKKTDIAKITAESSPNERSRKGVCLEKKTLEFEREIKALRACVNIQQRSIENYETQVNSIQSELRMLKDDYNLKVRECTVANEELEKTQRSLQRAKTEIKTALSTVEFLDKLEDSEASMQFGLNGNTLHMGNFGNVKKVMDNMQDKNVYLQNIFTLLMKKIDNFYRTIFGPMVFLTKELPESEKELVSFLSEDSLLAFLNRNSTILEQVETLVRESGLENPTRHRKAQQKSLADLDSYFLLIEEIIAHDIEQMVRQKACV